MERSRGRRLAGLAVGGLAGALLAFVLLGSDPPSTTPPKPTWAGLGISPQAGLVPLGSDAASGLPEFAVSGTGRVPKRNADGRLETGAGTAVVLVLLPGGAYHRGAQRDPAGPNHDGFAHDSEEPVTAVRVPPFLLAKHETTVAQWARLAGEESATAGALPRTDLGWDEARRVLDARGLRLPSEAEWEYACRAGTSTRYVSGDEEGDLSLVGWYRGNSRSAEAMLGEEGGAVHPVGELPPNPFGLHDMHGNVAEWCEDRWHATYRGAPVDGSAWTVSATQGRIHRGGSWRHDPDGARSAARALESPRRTRPWLGVRIARTIEP